MQKFRRFVHDRIDSAQWLQGSATGDHVVSGGGHGLHAARPCWLAACGLLWATSAGNGLAALDAVGASVRCRMLGGLCVTPGWYMVVRVVVAVPYDSTGWGAAVAAVPSTQGAACNVSYSRQDGCVC
jgi:hypothetical protein